MFKKAKLIYSAIVCSAMIHGAPIWFSLVGTEATKTNLIAKLEQAQNRCLCTIAFATLKHPRMYSVLF